MSNPYYENIRTFVPGTLARGGDVDNDLDAITSGFDSVYADIGTTVRFTNADAPDMAFTENATSRSLKVIGFDVSGAKALVSYPSDLLAQVQASASAAATSESNAATSESNAATSASNAATSASNAATSETNAEAWSDIAELWATELEDVIVAGGKYSAYHWAQKASTTVAGFLTSAQTVSGAWTFSAQITKLSHANAEWHMDDGSNHYKAITCNDGNGNWNFRLNNYVDTGTMKYKITGAGAAYMKFTGDAAAGAWGVYVADTGTADAAVSWSAYLELSLTTFTVGGILSTTGAGTIGGLLTASAGIDLEGEVREEVYAISGTTPSLDPANGTVQTHSLSGATTYSMAAGFGTGESLALHITQGGGGGYSVTWPTSASSFYWIGGSAPDLSSASGVHIIVIEKVGSSYYASYVGEAS